MLPRTSYVRSRYGATVRRRRESEFVHGGARVRVCCVWREGGVCEVRCAVCDVWVCCVGGEGMWCGCGVCEVRCAVCDVRVCCVQGEGVWCECPV